MVSLDWHVESRDGVSLIELLVANPADTARRVRIGNRLDGELWPPRREGVPEKGWDDGGFEGVLAAGERLGLGYASPAAPAEPPAEIVWTERAAEPARDGDRGATPGVEPTPAGVVRELGDPRPPADAVPEPSAYAGASARTVESRVDTESDRGTRRSQ